MSLYNYTPSDIIPSLVNPPGKEEKIRQLFVDVGCFEKICEVLSLVKEEAKEVSTPTPHSTLPHTFHTHSLLKRRAY